MEKPLEASADERGGEAISRSAPPERIETCLVILPTYNEGESILRILGEIQAKVPGAEILVVD
ncbi:MAG: hypothetical protein EBV83_10555, partial [Verrucomicrobia bacterium]|nr:hypothetical protein [Verrucomicrobiota bacterium]